jgi:hypothetical protein
MLDDESGGVPRDMDRTEIAFDWPSHTAFTEDPFHALRRAPLAVVPDSKPKHKGGCRQPSLPTISTARVVLDRCGLVHDAELQIKAVEKPGSNTQQKRP